MATVKVFLLSNDQTLIKNKTCSESNGSGTALSMLHYVTSGALVLNTHVHFALHMPSCCVMPVNTTGNMPAHI